VWNERVQLQIQWDLGLKRSEKETGKQTKSEQLHELFHSVLRNSLKTNSE